MKNTATHYGWVAKALHWTIALLVLMMIFMGYFFWHFQDKTFQAQVHNFHKSVGLLIFALMVIRFIWMLCNKKPAYPASMPRWQQIAAKTNAWCFYITLLLMPIFGWLIAFSAGFPPKFFGLFTVGEKIAKNKPLLEFAKDMHSTLAIIICILIGLHLLAIIHHTRRKDSILKRMC